MYIKTSSLSINIIPWIKKILNHQRPYRKKSLKIWWDSPFKKFIVYGNYKHSEIQTKFNWPFGWMLHWRFHETGRTFPELAELFPNWPNFSDVLAGKQFQDLARLILAAFECYLTVRKKIQYMYLVFDYLMCILSCVFCNESGKVWYIFIN